MGAEGRDAGCNVLLDRVGVNSIKYRRADTGTLEDFTHPVGDSDSDHSRVADNERSSTACTADVIAKGRDRAVAEHDRRGETPSNGRHDERRLDRPPSHDQPPCWALPFAAGRR